MAIDMDNIETMIEEHMKAQPYKCVCDSCGVAVTLDIDIDNDFDMTIIVPVCECKGE